MNTTIKLVLLLSLLFASCKKKDNSTGIPLVTVNITIYTNNPSYSALNTVGGWQYIDGGVRGILVYRASTDDFKAYDRNCTFQPEDPCAIVSVDSTNIIAVDKCCYSMFSIVDGGVIQGPAKFPLQSYTTSFDGSVLRIYN